MVESSALIFLSSAWVLERVDLVAVSSSVAADRSALALSRSVVFVDRLASTLASFNFSSLISASYSVRG